MKIVVLSDSHGKEGYVYDILIKNTDADMIIHLGDGVGDLDLSLFEIPSFKNKPVIRVLGNCDFFGDYPFTTFENICGYRFYITHGYRQNVKQGLSQIKWDAEKNDRNVILYGHTHIPYLEEHDGLHIFNPGAVANLQYGIITIDRDNAIRFEHK